MMNSNIKLSQHWFPQKTSYIMFIAIYVIWTSQNPIGLHVYTNTLLHKGDKSILGFITIYHFSMGFIIYIVLHQQIWALLLLFGFLVSNYVISCNIRIQNSRTLDFSDFPTAWTKSHFLLLVEHQGRISGRSARSAHSPSPPLELTWLSNTKNSGSAPEHCTFIPDFSTQFSFPLEVPLYFVQVSYNP